MKSIYVESGKLDRNQVTVYNLKEDRSFIVHGCAGSGKTSLALLRMQKLLADETSHLETHFYYVTIVRELVECIRGEITEALHAQYNDYAITYDNWKKGEISDWQRNHFWIKARKTANNGSITINKKPDYLFIDECQDFEENQIDALIKGAEKGITFYGDDSQYIMSWQERSPVTLKWLSENRLYKGEKIKIYELMLNYRLSKPIALFAQEISGRNELADHCKGVGKEKPFVISVDNEDDAYEFIEARIQNSNDVGIALFENAKVKVLYERLGGASNSRISARWNIEDSSYSYLKNTPVKIMTYHNIKGQQFETVFCIVPGELSPEAVGRLYVGVTRAERYLYVLCIGEIPSCLRNIPKALYETTDRISEKEVVLE